MSDDFRPLNISVATSDIVILGVHPSISGLPHAVWRIVQAGSELAWSRTIRDAMVTADTIAAQNGGENVTRTELEKAYDRLWPEGV